MAKTAIAIAQQAPSQEKGPSFVVQAIVLLVLTGIAAGIGLFAGSFMSGGQSADTPAADAGGHDRPDQGAAPPDPAIEDLKRGLIPLAPIMTNLAAPAETWVRIETVAIFAEEPDPALADLIHQDILAYLRTVKLHQVESASGFQHLKADLDERARIRSGGKVKGLLIRTLLFE